MQQSSHLDLINPIHTDMYQITMAYAYFRQRKHNEDAAFELFFRKCPFGGEYLIFCGLAEVLAFLNTYKFLPEHIDYLQNVILPKDADPAFFDYLRQLDCSQVRLYAFKEGSIVFPMEPLIRLEGPLGLIQMLETSLLNLVSYPSLMATNASRMKALAGEKVSLMEFGLRRAQGPDGGFSASYYSYIGGFHSTSNVLAGMKLGIPVVGTMAHSFVTSYSDLASISEEFTVLNGVNLKATALKYRKELGFENTNDGELAAFISFARDFPQNFTCLVDTYDTLGSGVPNFICVGLALIEAGEKPNGIRLDSGDLATLSKEAKKMIKEIGAKIYPEIATAKVVASNDINEESIIELNKNEHQIDVFGIGTNLVTCQKQPALGLVYKLVELLKVPRMKCSEEPSKSTFPGIKNVYRVFVKSSKYPAMDIITKSDEKIEKGKSYLCREMGKFNHKIEVTVERAYLLNEQFWNGKILNPIQNIKGIRDHADEEKKIFNPDVLKVKSPTKYLILLTEAYFRMFADLFDHISIVRKFD